MALSGIKVAINIFKIDTAYGGGNQFVNYLENYLIDKGCTVTRELIPGLDIILIINVGPSLSSMSFTPAEIFRYLKIYPGTRVIQRINTADEPRGKNLGINDATLKANELVDYTVFVSHYIKQLFETHGIDLNKPHRIIHTGSDESIFNPEGRAELLPGEPVRIVTHHWSDNFLKGFDFYERLDRLLDLNEYSDRLEFTLIGNRPLGIEFSNTKLLPPLNGEDLADELRRHHLYLTGCRHEAAGNHYIEAISCGLPVLYYESGSTGEYCEQYGGIGFDLVDFEKKLQLMLERLPEQRKLVLNYGSTARDMADKYWEVMQEVVEQKGDLSKSSPSLIASAETRFTAFWNKALEKAAYELSKLKIKNDF